MKNTSVLPAHMPPLQNLDFQMILLHDNGCVPLQPTQKALSFRCTTPGCIRTVFPCASHQPAAFCRFRSILLFPINVLTYQPSWLFRTIDNVSHKKAVCQEVSRNQCPEKDIKDNGLHYYSILCIIFYNMAASIRIVSRTAAKAKNSAWRSIKPHLRF